LPHLENIEFKRDGQLSWLELDIGVEAVWPELLAFVISEGLDIEVSDSLVGNIVTAWRSPSIIIPRSGVMQKMFGDKTKENTRLMERVVFRLERGNENNTSRLFTRLNVIKKGEHKNGEVDVASAWAHQNNDANKSSQILAKLMVFLGLSEAKANNILSELELQSIKHGLLLEHSEQGQDFLLIWDEYKTAFNKVAEGVSALGVKLDTDDADDGVIHLLGDSQLFAQLKGADLTAENTEGLTQQLQRLADLKNDKSLALSLNFHRVEPHVFAVELRDEKDKIMSGESARLLLDSIRSAIIAS
jgi:uncharacterized lipoprotein